MIFKNRAQGATEYLIVLAIVIVIALVAVGVLGGIPGIGGSAGSKASQSYWRTADIGITSVAITADNSLDMTIKNNLADTVTVNEITLGTDTISRSDTLNPGGSTTISDSVTDVCSSSGDSFSLDVEVKYTNEANGANYTFDGGGTQLEGTCAD